MVDSLCCSADSSAQFAAFSYMKTSAMQPQCCVHVDGEGLTRCVPFHCVQAVPAAERQKLFNTYIQAVTQLQQAAQERATRARAGFQVPFIVPFLCLSLVPFQFGRSGARHQSPRRLPGASLVPFMLVDAGLQLERTAGKSAVVCSIPAGQTCCGMALLPVRGGSQCQALQLVLLPISHYHPAA